MVQVAPVWRFVDHVTVIICIHVPGQPARLLLKQDLMILAARLFFLAYFLVVPPAFPASCFLSFVCSSIFYFLPFLFLPLTHLLINFCFLSSKTSFELFGGELPNGLRNYTIKHFNYIKYIEGH